MGEIESLLNTLEAVRAEAIAGSLDGVDREGRVHFRPDGATESVPVLLGLAASDAEVVRAARAGGRALALCLPGAGDRLVLLGLLRERVAAEAATDLSPGIPACPQAPPEEAVIDGKVVRFEAREEIVLRCGEGSITLRHDGKIVIKGTHLLSRASGVNRIKGGQVNIN